MKIRFYNETNLSTFKYQRLIEKVLKNRSKNKYMNIVFTDNENIHKINKEYRNIDRPTDVISFANCDDEANEDDKEMGDVFISLEKAFEQAKEYGHSNEREVAFLAVHAYLHLCGYDHMTPEDEKEMFTIQDDILNKAGIKR